MALDKAFYRQLRRGLGHGAAERLASGVLLPTAADVNDSVPVFWGYIDYAGISDWPGGPFAFVMDDYLGAEWAEGEGPITREGVTLSADRASFTFANADWYEFELLFRATASAPKDVQILAGAYGLEEPFRVQTTQTSWYRQWIQRSWPGMSGGVSLAPFGGGNIDLNEAWLKITRLEA